MVAIGFCFFLELRKKGGFKKGRVLIARKNRFSERPTHYRDDALSVQNREEISKQKERSPSHCKSDAAPHEAPPTTPSAPSEPPFAPQPPLSALPSRRVEPLLAVRHGSTRVRHPSDLLRTHHCCSSSAQKRCTPPPRIASVFSVTREPQDRHRQVSSSHVLRSDLPHRRLICSRSDHLQDTHNLQLLPHKPPCVGRPPSLPFAHHCLATVPEVLRNLPSPKHTFFS